MDLKLTKNAKYLNFEKLMEKLFRKSLKLSLKRKFKKI